jgi:hypothetical protein
MHMRRVRETNRREQAKREKENTMSVAYTYEDGFIDGKYYESRKHAWIKCSERLPDTDREVFGWAKGYGIFYTARYNNRWHQDTWNLPWEITHWMERPRDPQ